MKPKFKVGDLLIVKDDKVLFHGLHAGQIHIVKEVRIEPDRLNTYITNIPIENGWLEVWFKKYKGKLTDLEKIIYEVG